MKIWNLDKEDWLGVYGFFERDDGQLWAHGGLVRCDSTSGFIWRIDQGRAEGLRMLEDGPPRGKGLRADGPSLPVTHIVQDPKTRELIIEVQ